MANRLMTTVELECFKRLNNGKINNEDIIKAHNYLKDSNSKHLSRFEKEWALPLIALGELK